MIEGEQRSYASVNKCTKLISYIKNFGALVKCYNFILLISYWWIFQTHKIKYGDFNQNRSHQPTVSKPKQSVAKFS